MASPHGSCPPRSYTTFEPSGLTPGWHGGVEADRLLAGGADTAEVARQLGVSEQTYFRWRNQFGGLKAEDAKELKKLRAENQRLKRLLADAELDKDMLREVAKGEF